MTPPKPLAAQIDESIEGDIDFWVESKQRDAEQIDLFEIEQDFSPESGDQYSVR